MNALGRSARRTIHIQSTGRPCADANKAAFVEMLARVREPATELRRCRDHDTESPRGHEFCATGSPPTLLH